MSPDEKNAPKQIQLQRVFMQGDSGSSNKPLGRCGFSKSPAAVAVSEPGAVATGSNIQVEFMIGSL